MNRLANATSPYLLQHKDNPVDWWPFGPEALAEASRTGKPILISIGYAACHWCHVMAHESFEDPATAAVMNELFVNIKVDREERPDVDQVYMAALQALGQQGGWPLTMFLTPAGEPVWGGTYFPPEPRYGRPSFRDVLRGVAAVFRDDAGKAEHNRDALLAHLKGLKPPATRGALDPAVLDDAARRIAGIMDLARGGIGGAPKFPNGPVLELLWRGYRRTGEAGLLQPVLVTLRQMAKGGIHDQLGGGFARYSVDERWLVPHFEKMLYDNAQLLELYALGFSETKDPLFAEAARGIVHWLEREMIVEGGGFASSLDADSEGHEGRFYVWRTEEIEAVLGPEDAALFAAAYDVTAEGNWEGVSILNRLGTEERLFAEQGERLDRLRRKLLEARARRVRPGRDDKVLADWNGLMIAARARAAAVFEEPGWIELAENAFDFVAEEMGRADRLGHAFRGGRLVFPGFAADHAAMARAAVVLTEAAGDRAYLGHARRWIDTAYRDYAGEGIPGLSTAARDAMDLPVRPHPTLDDAMPNANALLLEAEFGLAAMTGDDALRDSADHTLNALSGAILGNVLGHASLLNVLDRRLHGAEIVVLGTNGIARGLAAAALSFPFTERWVLRAASAEALPEGHAVRRAAGQAAPAAFVCFGEHCSLPLSAPAELLRLLREGPSEPARG